MSVLNPNKLHVNYLDGVSMEDPVVPRAYTLTHSDITGDLYLSIGAVHNYQQISGWYTRFMRDEVLAEWQFEHEPVFHVHCHVSGGFLFGSPGWRSSIFRQHMSMVLQAFRYGDQSLFDAHPDLDQANIWVHFHAKQDHYNRKENWGKFGDYHIGSKKVSGEEARI